MYLYNNYILIIPTVHIIIKIYVQKVLLFGTSLYIQMYLRTCIHMVVQKIEWTSILFYIKSRRYSIFQFSFFKKNSPHENSFFSLLNFFKAKPKVSTYNVTTP